MIGWLLAILFILTFGVVFFGAPYVPTKQKDVERLFELVDFDGGRLVDFGAGDGRLMLAAAKRGIESSGWELSPVIWLIAWLRLRRYRREAQLHFGSFWRARLPDDTTAVFTFLVGHQMKKLERLVEKEAGRLNRPIRLISYGFDLADRTPEKQQDALIVYRFEP
ncbi:MAG TPA: hypothetical protein VFL81_00880 [Candidatus Saccharimonadales bacterium]|nr:hypothetical protein [Candidatus Saccharimonadales bacterium]